MNGFLERLCAVLVILSGAPGAPGEAARTLPGLLLCEHAVVAYVEQAGLGPLARLLTGLCATPPGPRHGA